MKDYSDYSDDHADRREAKRQKRNQMVVTGRSTKTVLLPLLGRSAANRRRKEARRAR